MKYVFFLTAIVLASCGTVDSPTPKTQSLSIDLFGVSYYDSKYHFIKMELPSQKITVLSASDSIQTGISNQAAFNPETNEYYFISNKKIIVMNTVTGEFIKSFNLAYADTNGLVYNSSSKKLNALSYIGASLNFAAIDAKTEKMNIVSTLTDIYVVVEESASIDNTSGTYYFATPSNNTLIKAIDTHSGAVVNTYDALSDFIFKGVISQSDTTLFGMDLSHKQFFVFNLVTGKIRRRGSFVDSAIDLPNKTIVDGVYFYQTDYQTLNGVDVETGTSILSITSPNELYNFIPVHRK